MSPPILKPSHERRRVTYRRLRLFMQAVNGRVRALRKRVRDVEVTVDPLIDHVVFTESEIRDLDRRVSRLERARRRRPTRA